MIFPLIPFSARDRQLDRLYLFFVAVYFAQGMVGLAYEPINYLLKDGLGLSPAQSGAFVAWMSAPFLLKPLLGLLSDALPLAGRRRVPHLLLASAFTSAAWAALALRREHAYLPALVLLTAVNVGIAFCDVLCDGVMVEEGRRREKTGLYQAAQIGTLYLTLLATGAGGGWLAGHASYRTIFGLTAAFPLLIFATTFLVPESARPCAGPGAAPALRALAAMASTRSFWAACGVILLFNFTPFQGTAMFYYQSEALGFSKLLVGGLTSVGGVAGAAGAALFGALLAGRARPRGTASLVRWTVAGGAALNLLYLLYRGPASALALTALFGAAGVLMRLSLMELAARCSPPGAEATAFAVFMSVFNLAAWSSNRLGASLYEALGAGPGGPAAAMAAMILLSSACMAACWPLAHWTEPAERRLEGAEPLGAPAR